MKHHNCNMITTEYQAHKYKLRLVENSVIVRFHVIILLHDAVIVSH